LQGASAIEQVLKQRPAEKLRVLVVWEPVIAMDWSAPSTANLKRVLDLRVQQYWDPDRLLSKAMGEHDKASIVWDWIGVYSKDTVWEGAPPNPEFHDGPVVRVIPGFMNALELALARNKTQ
jgi:hypothetical protein